MSDGMESLNVAAVCFIPPAWQGSLNICFLPPVGRGALTPPCNGRLHPSRRAG